MVRALVPVPARGLVPVPALAPIPARVATRPPHRPV
jgi:hypothetical protein